MAKQLAASEEGLSSMELVISNCMMVASIDRMISE
jgi:hypothetical protein